MTSVLTKSLSDVTSADVHNLIIICEVRVRSYLSLIFLYLILLFLTRQGHRLSKVVVISRLLKSFVFTKKMHRHLKLVLCDCTLCSRRNAESRAWFLVNSKKMSPELVT
jgi:hypothetical protein